MNDNNSSALINGRPINNNMGTVAGGNAGAAMGMGNKPASCAKSNLGSEAANEIRNAAAD